ncbi:hypothetical protein TpMuguga_02g00816 [Theileria parva strain Muguga]|uniref:Uncharacterized protein n=1 Tax=Theileria parva TaxID=5875 RepID=Q4N422_THEPA|nr:uncharacterized protein TpMuguga_02g00816 [Theileria parva strain Muguga]EAN33101.1 hypothetical protein TpMuguga_02g00816 [Theileria parva strain Muguga]|eukprot:XP_765384.1 hypothetical protein [Theileria parva strain Muguga]
MTELKIQILRGINTYTDDLIPKKNINLNARREFNTNIGDLDVDDKVPNRSRNFVVYEPPKRNTIDIDKTDTNEKNKEFSINLEGNEGKPGEDKIGPTVDIDLGSFLMAEEPKDDKTEPVKENNEYEFDLTENTLNFGTNVTENEDVDPIDRAKTETDSGESDSDDSLEEEKEEKEKFVKKKKLTKEDFTDKFEKFMNVMKEKFDKDEIREKHERNMEKIKLGLETLVSKMSNKKKDSIEASKTRKSSSEISDDSRIGISKESLSRLKGQMFAKATEELFTNDFRKRCCFKVAKRKKRY